MVLMGIFYEIAEKEVELELLAILGISAAMLLMDYFKKRRIG